MPSLIESRPPPTCEQQVVIDAPIAGGTVVLAGPGTGKTSTLIARVGRIVDEGGRPLVLSFTRAVVRELHDRLRLIPSTDARYLRPVTFDSFGTRMLSSIPRLIGWRGWETAGYDGRIDAAIGALADESEAQEWVTSRFDHIVVDEVQDLVGRRGRLVLALLDLIPQFTLLGDPAQGIYSWQEDAGELSADAFLEEIRIRHGDRLLRFDLTVNHRARREAARGLAAFRPGLMDIDDAADHRDALMTGVLASEPLGTLANAAHLLTLLRGSTAVLCRTNLEALIVSEALFGAGVDHVLRRAATDRAVVPWLAEIVRARRGAISRSAFLQRYDEAELKDEMTSEDAWELLTQVGGADDRLTLDRLADAIRRGRLPDELQAGADADIVVSTVHRAKGLEFDNVAIVLPPDWRRDADPAEDARVLFVAMTRARDELAHIERVDTFGWRQDPSIDRWYRCRPNQAWQTLGFELGGDDTHKMHPAGSYLMDEDPAGVQDRLRDRVTRGDRADLELALVDDGEEPHAWFVVRHESGPIAVTGEQFGRALARRIRAKRNTPNRWPKTISGLRVEGLDTVAGLEGIGEAAGLGAGGVWLRARIVGLGRVDWGDGGADR